MAASSERLRALTGRAALWLFAALSGFFVATSPPAMDISDVVVMFRLTRAMVDEGELSFTPLPGFDMPDQRAPDAPDGSERRWSKYGLAPTLAMLPGYALSRLLLTWSGVREESLDWHPWMKRYLQDQPERLAAAGADHYCHFLRWDWDFAPILALRAFPVRETLLLPAAMQRPGVVLAILLSAAGVFMLGALGLLRTWRAAQAEGLA